jgi:hypothetical protein
MRVDLIAWLDPSKQHGGAWFVISLERAACANQNVRINSTPSTERPYDAAVVRLKDAKGLCYLEPLLRHPGRSFHVAELIRLATCPGGCGPAAEDGTAEAVERTRKAVTNRIRQTLVRIANVHRARGWVCRAV